MNVSLNKNLYLHGETIFINLDFQNNSKKTVKRIRCALQQHVLILKENFISTKTIAHFESHEKCPVTPAMSGSSTFELNLSTDIKRKRGLALEGNIKEVDIGLLPTTIENDSGGIKEELDPEIKVGYTLKVSLVCGTLGGELSLEVPFELVRILPANKRDNFDFSIEEFTKFRRGKSFELLN